MWDFAGEKAPARQRLKRAVIEGLNAWIDFRVYPALFFFISDSLYEAMLEAGMTGFAPNSIWSEV